jgi:2-hydroxychromene-2-carboxylate isomerase
MIDFFFDCSSPWTYLAFHNIQPLAKEFGEEISWRPILVGGIFNTINPSVYASRDNPVPAKLSYQKKDMADWARAAGLAIKMRPTVFPVNSVKAMRGCIFLGRDMVPFARAVFEIGARIRTSRRMRCWPRSAGASAWIRRSSSPASRNRRSRTS